MKRISILVLLAFAIFASYPTVAFGQSALPGACYATQSGAGLNLLKVDLATAVAQVQGTTTDPLPGLAINSKGNLYATSRSMNTQLYRVDAADGSKVNVGPLEDAGGNPFHFIQGIAFDSSDVLFGSGEDDFGDSVLVQIDTLTGTVTSSVVASSQYAGLAFDPTDGTLFASGGGQFDVDQILTLNTATGVATALANPTGFGGGTPDIAFDASGNLFGVKGGGKGGPTVLIAINKATGVGAEVDTVTVASVDQTHLSGLTCYNPSDDGGEEGLTILVDIKPQACPNQLNANAKNTVNVAILGAADFDVTTIDPSSLTLEGLTPNKWSYADISQPPAGGGDCACTEAGADGFVDLKLEFKNQVILSALGDFDDGEKFTLDLEGALFDTTAIMGSDCVVIQEPNDKNDESVSKDGDAGSVPSNFELEQNYPNPFNPTTSITFALPQEAFVELSVFNAMGQRVATLVSSSLPSGRHSVQWNATDDSGRSLTSGLYIYRLSAGGFVQSQKMLLLE